MSLNKEFKEKWIAGLRSGKYTKATSILKLGDNCYCALGVALVENGYQFIGANTVIHNEKKVCGYDVLMENGYPEERFREIWDINDNEQGLNFDQIADYVENNY